MNLKALIEKLALRTSEKALVQLKKEENYDFLKKNSLFQDLGPQAFVFLYNHLIERRYKKGEMVFKEGNPGICLFIIKKGRVEIFSNPEDNEAISERTVFTVLETGVLFGELSLIAAPYRATSARVLDHGTILLTLSIYDLNNLCDQYPREGIKLMKGLTTTITNHLAEVDARLREATAEIEKLKEKLATYERK